MQRPNASPHGDLNAVAATIPPTPGNTPPHEGFRYCRSNCPINPERTQRTRTGAEHHRMAGNEHYVRLRSRRAPFWQDLAEMYSRTAHFGKNGVFCTLQDGKALSRSTFSEYLARKVWFSCPSVHNARFLPRFSAICPMSRKILLHDSPEVSEAAPARFAQELGKSLARFADIRPAPLTGEAENALTQ